MWIFGQETACSSNQHNINMTKSRNPRESIYHVTMPPSSYPSASPYAALSKYFAKLVRLRVITRSILKQLLYVQSGIPPPDLSKVKYRHHTSHVTLRLNDKGGVESDFTDSEDSETESSSSFTSRDCFSEPEANGNGKIARQDAMDHGSKRSLTSVGSSCVSNPFGYIRYYNDPSRSDDNSSDKLLPGGIHVTDCTHERFQGIKEFDEQLSPEVQSDQCPVIRILPDNSVDNNASENVKMPLAFVNQYSENSDNSSFECGSSKPYMACEDLVNLDQNMAMESMGSSVFSHVKPLRQSCPTKFVADRFNDSSLTSVCTPGWQSCNDNLLSKPEDNSDDRKHKIKVKSKAYHDSINFSDSNKTFEVEEHFDQSVFHSLDPPNSTINQLTTSESVCSDMSQEAVKMIIEPPLMFQNVIEVEKATVNLRRSGFENHSLNSDKKIRRSTAKGSDASQYADSPVPPVIMRTKKKVSESRQCVSCHYATQSVNDIDSMPNCACCNRSRCHSPRSSDSGVAGSCNMASPEIHHRGDSLYSPGETRSLNESSYPKTLYHDYSMSTGEISKLNYARNKLTLSEIEAANFEAQCPCTSPFSTPRTSCQPSITSENVSIGNIDSANTSVTSSIHNSIPYPSNVRKVKKHTDCKKNPSNYEKPQLCRKPSKHNEDAKNVRQAVNHGWSTPDVSILTQAKPSNHYHMRIYREISIPKYDEGHADGQRLSRNTTIQRKDSRDVRSPSQGSSSHCDRRVRSRSEDLAKKYSISTNAQTGHVVYRSDLYAHWWMKAKLPISVITPGKDNFSQALCCYFNTYNIFIADCKCLLMLCNLNSNGLHRDIQCLCMFDHPCL